MISRVQWYAVQLLIARDQKGDITKFIDQVKLALITYDPATYLPSVTGEEPYEEDISPGEDLSDTTGTWDFSKSDITPEEAMAILEDLEQEHMFVTDLSEQEIG